MDIPNLDNLINAMLCDDWIHSKCEHCPYGYQYWDDRGDSAFWFCDEEKIRNDSLFYLQLYKYLIEEQKNEN